MPIVRVTPETAVETVEQLIREVRETIESAGRSPALIKLRERAEELLAVIDAVPLEVEVKLLENLHPTWTGTLASWLGIEPDPLVAVLRGEGPKTLPRRLDKPVSIVRVSGSEGRTAQVAGATVAPVLVVAHGSTESPSESAIEHTIEEIKRRPLTLLASPEGSDWARGLAALGSREKWMCRFLELESLADRDLEGALTRPPWLQAGRLATAWSVSEALSSLQSAFAVALENEGRTIASKRASLEQRATADQQLSTSASPTELVGEARGLIQKRFDTFSKSAVAAMKELVEPYEGTLRLEVEARIDAMEDFSYEKRPKTFRVTIPKELEEGLMARTREALEERGRADVEQMRKMLTSVKEDVEELFEERGGPPVTLHLHPVQGEAFDKLVGRATVLQRPYKGELTRRGPMDFFMQARRYQMMFFMVASVFGLSFIRSYREFTIPVGILLLLYGLLSVVNRSRKEAAENKANELDKARSTFKTDLGRSMSDVQKGWTQLLSNHLSEEQNKTLEALESAAKASASEADRRTAESKELLQKQLKGLDLSQRKITEGVKKAEAAAADLHALSEQLVEFYATMVRPAEPAATPAAGAPGAVPTPAPAAPAAGTPSPAAEALKKLEEIRKGAASAGAGKAPAGGAAARGAAARKRPSKRSEPAKPPAARARPPAPAGRGAAPPKAPGAAAGSRPAGAARGGGGGDAQKKLEEMKKKLKKKSPPRRGGSKG